jgi:signal transduction histidine kinase
MDLKHKISLQFVVILLAVGGVLLLSGLTVVPVVVLLVHKLLQIPVGTRVPLLIGLYLCSFVVIFMMIGIFLGRKISKPLFFLIQWIENLSEGKYQKPDFPNLATRKFGVFLELESKLGNLTDRLRSVEQERQALEESRRNWASGITHDLKTPLSYIKGYAAMLRSDHAWEEAEVKEFSRIIEEKSIHIEQLIQDLSIVYQLEERQIPLNERTLDLVSFLELVLADLKKHPLAERYDIQFKSPARKIRWTFDEHLLKRALENFIMNAIRHNPPETTIQVTTELKEDKLWIVIQDNGTGMDRKTIQHLFDRYYRGTPTDRSALGSGLGMVIAKQFIERMQGFIQVESKQNEGTRITLWFPYKN